MTTLRRALATLVTAVVAFLTFPIAFGGHASPPARALAVVSFFFFSYLAFRSATVWENLNVSGKR